MHFPLSFCKNASPYFFHGAFAPSFIWSRRPWSAWNSQAPSLGQVKAVAVTIHWSVLTTMIAPSCGHIISDNNHFSTPNLCTAHLFSYATERLYKVNISPIHPCLRPVFQDKLDKPVPECKPFTILQRHEMMEVTTAQNGMLIPAKAPVRSPPP